jgi:hypothetical protein
MVKTITVDPELADRVERDLFSIRPDWKYYNYSVNSKNNLFNVNRSTLDEINRKYGPVNDTQRFTDAIYDPRGKHPPGNFFNIRSNPKSRYNVCFPAMAKLVDHMQETHIPKNYKVNRLMFNMQTIRPEWSMQHPHPDFLDKDFITILYYVNNSDGDTFFFEGSECVHRSSPIKGTAVMTPSCMWHAGSSPTKTETRVVINMCFGPKQ